MRPEQLKNSAIFQALKKDKKAQRAVLRLGKSEDWIVLKQFISGVKQLLLEATLEVDDFKEVRRYKHLIAGMESIVLLPGLVSFVKEQEKKDKLSKEEKEKEAERKKYSPGTFVRSVVSKIRG